MNENTNKVIETLEKAAAIIKERAEEYKGKSDMFFDIAEIAKVDVSQVFAVLKATKVARIIANPDHIDSLVDYVAYSAFEIVYLQAKEVEEKKKPIPAPNTTPPKPSEIKW